MTFDRQKLAQIADWEMAAVAVSLPWSTSATSILLVVWLLTLLPTLDLAAVRREFETAAGGLPVLLWALGAAGMLWADVSWSERFAGLDGFHRLLVVPLLLAQFSRSKNGAKVIGAFLASSALLLVVSWAMVFVPAWQPAAHPPGIPVHDVIAQCTIFLICAFGLLWRAIDDLRCRHWRWAPGLLILAAAFLANVAFVAISRGDMVVFPFLVLLLGWRQFGGKGVIAATLAAVVVAGGAWMSSPYLQTRLNSAIEDISAYQATHADNDVGDHVEFLRKSLAFVREAPLIGHGTGAIADQFRRSTAGQSGAAAVASVNPHNQIFAVAIQLGVAGAAVLLAMWGTHYFLFAAPGLVAWLGTVVVVENVISSLTSSHLFDFIHGWLYILGVGILGGMMRRTRAEA
jgi:hypothetical protein